MAQDSSNIQPGMYIHMVELTEKNQENLSFTLCPFQ